MIYIIDIFLSMIGSRVRASFSALERQPMVVFFCFMQRVQQKQLSWQSITLPQKNKDNSIYNLLLMLGSRVRASLLFYDFLLARLCKRDFQCSRLLRKLFYDFLLARPCKQDFQCSRLLRKFRSRKTTKWLAFFIFTQLAQQKV